jgi:ankyrin repeat protein
MLASANGHLAVVKALVAAGADVNAASEVLSGDDVGLVGKLTSLYSFRLDLRHSRRHPPAATRRW